MMTRIMPKKPLPAHPTIYYYYLCVVIIINIGMLLVIQKKPTLGQQSSKNEE